MTATERYWERVKWAVDLARSGTSVALCCPNDAVALNYFRASRSMLKRTVRYDPVKKILSFKDAGKVRFVATGGKFYGEQYIPEENRFRGIFDEFQVVVHDRELKDGYTTGTDRDLRSPADSILRSTWTADDRHRARVTIMPQQIS